MRGLSCERGIALLVVLLVVAFLAVVVSAFAFSMRTELDAARSFREEAEAYFLARAAISRAVAEIVNMDPQDQRNPLYNSGQVAFGRGAYRVVVTDEESKIPLNQVQADTLRRLIQNTGVRDQQLADTIVDSILDWTDADNIRRPSGAEEEYYRSLPRPYHPKNGPFASLEELLLVKGMTREILYGTVEDLERLAALREARPQDRQFRPGEYLGIGQFLTVVSLGRVNIATADGEVLWALGLAQQEVEAIKEGGAQGFLTGRGRRPTAGIRLVNASQTFVIDAQGQPASSPVTYRITALVRSEGATRGASLRVLGWNERSR